MGLFYEKKNKHFYIPGPTSNDNFRRNRVVYFFSKFDDKKCFVVQIFLKKTDEN